MCPHFGKGLQVGNLSLWLSHFAPSTTPLPASRPTIRFIKPMSFSWRRYARKYSGHVSGDYRHPWQIGATALPCHALDCSVWSERLSRRKSWEKLDDGVSRCGFWLMFDRLGSFRPSSDNEIGRKINYVESPK